MIAWVVAVGLSCAADHGDGVWYQKAFAYETRLCSPSLEVGVRAGGWSVGYTSLVATRSRGLGVEDHDYDVASRSCLRNCETPAVYVTRGSVHGLYIRREWNLSGGLTVEAGLLAFVPRHEVTVSNWDEAGAVMPPHTYRNPREIKVSPSIGVGFRLSANVHGAVRYYHHVKGAGDNGFASRATLYSGPLVTMTVQYRF